MKTGGCSIRCLRRSVAGRATASSPASVRKADLKKLLATGLPVVELFADFALSPPQVSPSEESIGRLAAEHFLERGLRNLAYFASDWAWWIDTRRKSFARAVAQYGAACGYFELSPRAPAGSGSTSAR